METIRNFFKDESGAALVEYGLLVALIAVICIVAVGALGTAISTKLQGAATEIAK